MLRTRIHVRSHERALVFVRGDLKALWGPGSRLRFQLVDRLRGVTVHVVNTLDIRLVHPLLEVLVRAPPLERHLHVVKLGDTQRGLIWKDGRLFAILGPGLHAFWKEPFDLNVEVFDLAESELFTHARLDAVAGHPDAARLLRVVDAEPESERLVYRAGVLVARVTRGRTALWLDGRAVHVRAVDLREQTADVTGQEILTRDKVTLRVNLVLTWRVTDALVAASATSELDKALYREAQLALRAAVGARSLDELLSDKEAVGQGISRAIAERAKGYGVSIQSVGIRDLVLPGEMKTILNQVILAQKQAEANLIKRREETAAARSQSNTARLLSENPALARMKELEALQEILQGAKASFVFGPEGLMTQVRSLLSDSGAEKNGA